MPHVSSSRRQLKETRRGGGIVSTAGNSFQLVVQTVVLLTAKTQSGCFPNACLKLLDEVKQKSMYPNNEM